MSGILDLKRTKDIDFNVWVHKKNRSGFRFKMMVGKNWIWSKAIVRYIASGRLDLLVGAFSSTI